MTTNLSQAWMTFSFTLLALVLSGYLGLRRQFVLMAVCLICFFTLLTPSVVFGGELCKPIRYADGECLLKADLKDYIQKPLPHIELRYCTRWTGHGNARESPCQNGLIGSSEERRRKQSSQSRSVPGPAAGLPTKTKSRTGLSAQTLHTSKLPDT